MPRLASLELSAKSNVALHSRYHRVYLPGGGPSVSKTVLVIGIFSLLGVLWPLHHLSGFPCNVEDAVDASILTSRSKPYGRYTNPDVLKNGCSITVEFTEPHVTEEGFWALESAAANLMPSDRVCFALKISICQPYLSSGISFWEATTRSMEERAKPLFRDAMERGNVRVSILNHTKYHLNGCGDFRPGGRMHLDARFWGNDEFEPGIDADMILTLHVDSVFCRILDLNKWSNLDFAYIGPPWWFAAPAFVPASIPSTYWNDWHKSGQNFSHHTKLVLSDNQSRALVGNGGFAVRSRKWMQRAIRYCPHTKYAGLTEDELRKAVCHPHEVIGEDCYFSIVLGGLAALETPYNNPPRVATAYEAALFAAETRWPNFVYNISDIEMEEIAIQLWAGTASEAAKTYREANGKTIFPIGVHKPWGFNRISREMVPLIRKECPYLEKILPERYWHFPPWEGSMLFTVK